MTTTVSNIHQFKGRRSKGGQKVQRPTWQPQPSSLTRDELRQIVLEMLG